MRFNNRENEIDLIALGEFEKSANLPVRTFTLLTLLLNAG